MPELAQCFAFGDLDQQLPQIIAIVQLRKLSFLGSPEERLERTDDDVLFVGNAFGCRMQLLTGQPNKPNVEVIPQLGRSRFVARFQFADPVGDRFSGRHFPPALASHLHHQN